MSLTAVLALGAAGVHSMSAKSSAATQLSTDARIAERVSVRAAGRGNPRISLAHGRNLLTAYSGPTELCQTIERGEARPLSLTSADFDEDGVADLVSGYAGPSGGVITLHRGNVDSLYPNSAEAQRRRLEGTWTDSPFLSPALVFDALESPDFAGAGDFDGDGHLDLVTAARTGRAFYLLAGDGKGGLGEPTPIDLPGGVTALTVGEINRPDGLEDLVVATDGADGHQLLIYTGPNGASKATPRGIGLPTEAESLALGQLDDDSWTDLAVSAGHELIIVHGRKVIGQSPSTRSKTTRHPFPFAIRGLAVGNFSGSHRSEIALLADDGSLNLATPAEAAFESNSEELSRGMRWRSEAFARGSWTAAAELVCARVSSAPLDGLILSDPTSHRLTIVAAPNPDGAVTEQAMAVLDSDEGQAAVLPMRLNSDALSDLVILKRGGLAVAVTRPQATLVVTNTNDSGAGSLAEAIRVANNTPGGDAIMFRIQATGVPTIILKNPLPVISDAVLIDGTSQPGASRVEIDGSGTQGGTGLILGAGNCTVRGLVINRSFLSGIEVRNTGNVVEGNFIGTDAAGAAALPNGGNGVIVTGGPNNLVGGTAGPARNVISANMSFGVLVNASGNRIEGNFIGTNAAGNAALGNGLGGVAIGSVPAPTNNVVGGTRAGARNVVSGNFSFGVGLSNGTSGNQVQGNLIGTDAGGKGPAGNRGPGVVIFSGLNNLIGGTAPGAGNMIAFNGDSGVAIDGTSSTGNAILSNSTFSNTGLGIDLDCDGVTANDATDGDGGPNMLQNYPVLTSVTTAGQFATVAWELSSTPNTTFSIQFFVNSTCGATGFGEGETHFATALVTTGGTGGVSFQISNVFRLGQRISATATDPAGNTSEFSGCALLSQQTADLAITKSGSAPTVATGTRVIYTIRVTNAGPAAASDVTVNDKVPVGTTFASATTSQGAFSKLPLCGSEGAIAARLGTIAPGGFATVTLTLNVLAVSRSSVSNTATVTGSMIDPNTANNAATARTDVLGGGIVILRWQQLPSTAANPTPPPTNVVAQGGFSAPPSLVARGTLSPSDTAPCALNKVNVYKSDLQPVLTIPDNLWKSVAPDQLETTMAAAPAGSFYVLTNVWLCGDMLIESGGSNTVGVGAGPGIDRIKIKPSGKMKIIGSGYADPAQVFLDGLSFTRTAIVADSTLIVQKGTLTDGRTAVDATPPGKVVIISVRNSNGGISSIAYSAP